MSLHEIFPFDFNENIFKLLSNDCLLLTTEKDGNPNTMTVGWGGIGVMWGKNVVFTAVRPERFTHEILENTEYFSLSALTEEKRSAIGYCGRVSGRNANKLSDCSLTLLHEKDVPYIAESKIVFICKKLSRTPISPSDFPTDSAIPQKWYGGGYHSLFIGEIEKILTVDKQCGI